MSKIFTWSTWFHSGGDIRSLLFVCVHTSGFVFSSCMCRSQKVAVQKGKLLSQWLQVLCAKTTEYLMTLDVLSILGFFLLLQRSNPTWKFPGFSVSSCFNQTLKLLNCYWGKKTNHQKTQSLSVHRDMVFPTLNIHGLSSKAQLPEW